MTTHRLLPAIFAALALAPITANAQELVLLVRHAERADGGAPPAGMMAADPGLSEAGQQRANRLAVMLADAGLDTVFVTQFRRTSATAAPLVAKLGVTPISLPSADVTALVAQLKAGHANDNFATRG
jgi:broad specificity phosphatase PhoE